MSEYDDKKTLKTLGWVVATAIFCAITFCLIWNNQ